LIRPAQLLRVNRIVLVLLRHGLDELVFTIPWFRPIGFLVYLSPAHWLRRHEAPRGERIRRALEELGPMFVKFGQLLSTRRDLLPDDLAEELALLQDRVASFPSSEARRIIERSLATSLPDIFQEFDDDPIASASIAQVHGAVLRDGQQVVVKVVRPHIKRTIQSDLELLFIVAHLAQRYWVEGRRLRPVEVVNEYQKTIMDELDLEREAANAAQLRRNFEKFPALYVPAVHWEHTSRDVLVMERIYGVPISNIAELHARQVNMARLAELGVEIFFRQVFTHNFFHADMHPGNIFVDTTEPNQPGYIAVDFGIVGTLAPADQRYLAENFHAFFNRDFKRVAELHVLSGWVGPETRIDEFESAIRTVCEPIFQKPLKEISFGHVLLRLFQTARRYNMSVQPQLVLLQKTLLHIEGLGRQLYPDLDLWQTAKPFLERWMSEQVGVRRLFREVRQQFPRVIEHLPEAPVLAFRVLEEIEQGKLRVQWQSAQHEALRKSLAHANRRNLGAIFAATLSLAACIFLVALPAEVKGWLGINWPTWLLGGAALLAWFMVWRSHTESFD